MAKRAKVDPYETPCSRCGAYRREFCSTNGLNVRATPHAARVKLARERASISGKGK